VPQPKQRFGVINGAGARYAEAESGNECTSLETSPQHQRNAIPAFTRTNVKKVGVNWKKEPDRATQLEVKSPKTVIKGERARSERWRTYYLL
jgi:hypothetical protein